VGGEIFQTCPDRPWGPSSLLYNGCRVFPGGKERPGRDADLSPSSGAVGHERVELYLYSPYGPYGLYRASVLVQGCTLTPPPVRERTSWNPQGLSRPVMGLFNIQKKLCILGKGGLDSSVGIVTGYGLDGPGIEFR